VKHIDSALGIIRVEHAKGKKDRQVMLSWDPPTAPSFRRAVCASSNAPTRALLHLGEEVVELLRGG
jgi:hypothetical protein